MRRYGLRDDQGERIEGVLPGREDTVGVTAKDHRLFVEAVIYRDRAGIPWRDVPERVRDWLEKAGVLAVIPPQATRIEQREYEEDLYRMRHLIENFFATLTQFRGIATRYDKRASAFLGAIDLAASAIWLN